MKIKTLPLYLLALTLLGGLLASPVSAELQNGTHWLIKPGDSLYKISRSLFPNDRIKQQQLRREIVANNPQAFKRGPSSISVGERLALPDFAIQKQTKPAPVIIASQPVRAIKKPVIKPVKTEATGIDPEDIVGQVVINVGELTAENRGEKRKLKRQSDILRGDTLSTGTDSHTQVRMKDGALLSLRPHTDLRVAEYRYNGAEDGSERSLLELIKGGFRTITGAIGHKNKKNYRVKTTVATIGIRGTHYSLVMCQQQSCSGASGQVDDGLYGGVADGSIVIENDSGVHQFGNDQFFRLGSSTEIPVETLEPPSILQTGPVISSDAADVAEGMADTLEQDAPEANEESRSPRRPVVIFQPNDRPIIRPPVLPIADLESSTAAIISVLQPEKAPNGSAMLLGFSHLEATGVLTGAGAPVIVTAGNDNEIYLTKFPLPDGSIVERIPFGAKEISFDPELMTLQRHDLFMSTPTGLFTASIVPSSLGGNPLGVNWGRWNGEFTILEDGLPLDTLNNFHFIYSENLTSPTQLASLGGLGGSVIYNLAGGTKPTDQLGNVAATMPTITLDVNFTLQQINAYNVQATVGPNVFQAGTTNIPFNDLGRSFTIDATTACPSGIGCTGEASVVFVGGAAQGAMTSYHIEDVSLPLAVTGTAFMVRP